MYSVYSKWSTNLLSLKFSLSITISIFNRFLSNLQYKSFMVLKCLFRHNKFILCERFPVYEQIHIKKQACHSVRLFTYIYIILQALLNRKFHTS